MSRETELEDSIAVLIGERNDSLDKLAATRQREAETAKRLQLISALADAVKHGSEEPFARSRAAMILDEANAALAASEPPPPSMSKETAAKAYSALFGDAEPPQGEPAPAAEPPDGPCPGKRGW